jgi:integrase
MSVDEVKLVYEFIPSNWKACLLLLFTTGSRIGELIPIQEIDRLGKVIHLKGYYTKSGRARDVVMITEGVRYL